MKILHVLDHSLPLQSGYAFRSQNILQTQRRKGWQPVALTSPKHEESWKVPCEREEDISGIRYYRTGAISNNGLLFNKEIRLMKSLRRRIKEVAEVEKPDILHAHSPILNAVPALWVGHELRIPVVYEIRAFWEDAAVDHGNYSEGSWKYKMVRSIETWVCHKADYIGVLCQGLKDDLITRGIPPERIKIIYNGINADDFKPCEPDEEFIKYHNLKGKKVIGFIGSFYRYEGLDLLIDAFAHISTAMPESVLLLVGGGEIEKDLKEKAKNLGLNERVIFPGRISHDRIPGVYALIDVLVYPRYSMRLTELVTPLKPLEAMAMGKALVASDIGGHRELIRNNETGLLFPSDNKFALAESIEFLLKNHGLREKIERQVIEWVKENHTWDKTTSVYTEMYAKALEKYQGAKRKKRAVRS
jgi:PEP-CTERM/exosortase A-associated glycosyltransferase